MSIITQKDRVLLLGLFKEELLWMTIMLMVMSISTANAENWHLSANNSLALEYSENPSLSVDSRDASWRRRLDVTGLIEAQTPRTRVVIKPAIFLARYPGMRNLDNDILMLNMLATQDGARFRPRVSVLLKSDTTLTSELEDTGLIQARKRRLMRNVSPSFSYSINERLDLRFGMVYTDVTYQNVKLTGLSNYKYKLLDSTLITKIGVRHSVSTNIYASRMTSPEVDNVITDFGVRASYQYVLYPRVTGVFSVGVHQVNTEYRSTIGNKVANDTGVLGDVSITKRGEVTSWDVGFRRSIEPSGSGALVLNDRVDINYREKFSRTWSGRVNGLLLQNRPMRGGLIFSSRRYGRFSTWIIWHSNSALSVSMQYGYTWQMFTSSGRSVGSNDVGINMSYKL